MEVWKQIKDFEDYFISNYGNIKNYKNKIINCQIVKNKYKVVCLRKNKKRYNKMLSFLVLNTFFPIKEKDMIVAFKDNNCLNCNLNNLYWDYKFSSYKEPYSYTENNETWKSIKGLIGKYEISNCGNVRRLENNNRINVISKINKDGYKEVVLCHNKHFLVHRLVACNFLPYDETLIVNHMDGNKLNNCYKNLEWVTKEENRLHAIKLLMFNTKPFVFKVKNQFYKKITDIPYLSLNERIFSVNTNRKIKGIKVEYVSVKEMPYVKEWKKQNSLEKEKWRPLINTDNYEISNFGRIISYIDNGRYKVKLKKSNVVIDKNNNQIYINRDLFVMKSFYYIFTDLQNEQWKEVNGYLVSNCGRIKHNNKLLLPSKKPSGYLTVTLHGKEVFLHRLVLQTYKGESDLEVNHVDGNKLNNHIDNLEWVTSKENKQHAKQLGLTRYNNLFPIYVLNLHTKEVSAYNNFAEINKTLHIDKSNIKIDCKFKNYYFTYIPLSEFRIKQLLQYI